MCIYLYKLVTEIVPASRNLYFSIFYLIYFFILIMQILVINYGYKFTDLTRSLIFFICFTVFKKICVKYAQQLKR